MSRYPLSSWYEKLEIKFTARHFLSIHYSYPRFFLKLASIIDYFIGTNTIVELRIPGLHLTECHVKISEPLNRLLVGMALRSIDDQLLHHEMEGSVFESSITIPFVSNL
jgi:hypothetical protein